MTTQQQGVELAEALVGAIAGVVGPATSFIPLHEPEFRGNEWAYVKDCIDTGWVSSVGAYVDRIEADLADYTGAKRAVACGNGTAALHIAYLLAGIERGDEVLAPSLTFIATINPLSYIGAIPHFVDSCPVTLGVDPVALDAYLSKVAVVEGGVCKNRDSGAKIAALIVTHIFGHAADLDALSEVCRKWSLVLVEDAAEGLGTKYKGRHVGNDGLVSALSFNGNKIITTGGGGAVLTNDEALGKRAKHLTTTAKVPHKWDFVHDAVGYNYRMPNLNAALGCAQLERLPDLLDRKKLLASRYAEALADIANVQFIEAPAHSESNNWLNGVILPGLSLETRDIVLTMLNDSGYMSRPIWQLMHRLPMYADCPRAPLPVAERLEREVINIPSSACLADSP